MEPAALKDENFTEVPFLSTIEVGGNWFESLFGFSEKPGDYAYNKNHFILDKQENTLKSTANNSVYNVGRFATHSLEDLRKEALKLIS